MMMHSSRLFTWFFVFFLLSERWLVVASCRRETCDQTVAKIVTRSNDMSSFDNDFENGVVEPWIEQSEASARWKMENKTSPWQMDNAAPLPLNGQNYLRVDRGASLSFSVAVLRSPTFTLSPDNHNVTFSFSFWIRSKWPQFTNLELYLAKDGNESLLLSLYKYSDVNNLAWQSRSVSLTDETSSTLTLAFYGYCGPDVEDAVAIDDLRFITQQETTPSTALPSLSYSSTESTAVTDLITTITNRSTTDITGISATSTQPDTTSVFEGQTTTTSRPSTTDCLGYFEGDLRMNCWTLNGKCYCFSRNTAGLSWVNADAYCKDGNMTLVSIETEEENLLIYNHVETIPEMSNARYWSSGKYSLEEERLWEWASLEPFQPFTYTNWSPGEPKGNGPGFCVYLDFRSNFSNGYWKDLFCIDPKRFICESTS